MIRWPEAVSEALRNAAKPERVAELLTQLHGEHGAEDKTVSALCERIDNSQFDAQSWLNALVYLDAYLTQEQIEAPVDLQLGYLECACQSPEAMALRLPMVDLVEEMLDQFGFTGGV